MIKIKSILSKDALSIKLVVMLISIGSILYFQSNFFQLIFLDDDTLIFNKFSGLTVSEDICVSFNSNYLGGHYYRPITLISIVTDSIVGGQSFFIYHFNNFLIHLLTSILIFLIIRKLGYSKFNSFFTSTLFIVSSIQINAVGWIAGRGDLLAAVFSATALLFFLLFLNQGKIFLLLTVSILLLLAVLSKEVSIVVPFLFIGLFFVEGKEIKLDKKSIGSLVMILVVTGFYYLLRGVFLSGVQIDKFSFTTYYKNILVLPETISKFFIPLGIKALPSNDVFTSITGSVILIILLFIPFKLTKVNKLRYYFGMIWFVLLMLPGMVFRTMEQDGFYYWDCRSYLPLVGLVFVISEIFHCMESYKYKQVFYSIFTMYLLALGTTTFVKIKMYENPETYWNSVKNDFPNRFLPYQGLFNFYNHYKDYNNAENELLQGIKINPKEFSTRRMLINFYLNTSESNSAFTQIKDALQNRIEGSVTLIEEYISLAIELEKVDEIDEMIVLYSVNKEMKLKIKQAIVQKIELLLNSNEIALANLLSEKIQKFSL